MVFGVNRLKYFVSIESHSYHLWQIELLIESFKRRGLQNDLVIGVADNPNPVVQKYTHNLFEHPIKFVHPNQGGPLNKFYALLLALKNDLLPKPFVIIHPDMVIVKPVKPFGRGFLTQPENFEGLREQLPYSIDVGNIIGIGEGVSDLTFENAYVHCKESKTNDPETAAWMMAICEEVTRNKLEVVVDHLEQPMVKTDLNANFIHYKHGLPGRFHKKSFTFSEGEAFSLLIDRDPFEAIYNNNVTSSTHYMQKLIDFYWVRDDS